MKVFRSINKWLNKFWNSNTSMPSGIDSHKWDSKIEILGCLSSRSHSIVKTKGSCS